MKRMLAIGAALALASSIAAAQGYGNGPGMMQGYGGGMMGGSGSGGYGGAMMGGPLGLNLSDAQQDRIFAIQEANRRKNFDTMGQMRSETFKLRRMYNADNAEPKAIVEQQKKVDELRRQMLVSRLEMRKEMQSVLTPEQRKQARQFGPWWGEDSD